MRKTMLGLSLAAVAVAGVAWAEGVEAEAIPPDTVATLAPIAVQLLQAQFQKPPVKIDPNPDKALGYHVKQMVAVVLMPDKGVTAKAIDEASDKEVPLCVVATKSLSFQDKDVVINGDKLAYVEFDGTFKLPVFFLSVKGKEAERNLTIYSKDSTPIASVPLKKEACDPEAPVQVKLDKIDLEKKSLEVTFGIGGAYQSAPIKMGFVD
jgi:hypothetical protein